MSKHTRTHSKAECSDSGTAVVVVTQHVHNNKTQYTRVRAYIHMRNAEKTVATSLPGRARFGFFLTALIRTRICYTSHRSVHGIVRPGMRPIAHEKGCTFYCTLQYKKNTHTQHNSCACLRELLLLLHSHRRIATGLAHSNALM